MAARRQDTVTSDPVFVQVRHLMTKAGYITTKAVNDSPRHYKSFSNLHITEDCHDKVFGKAGDKLRQHFWTVLSKACACCITTCLQQAVVRIRALLGEEMVPHLSTGWQHVCSTLKQLHMFMLALRHTSRSQSKLAIVHSGTFMSQDAPTDKPIGCIRTGPAELSGIVSCQPDNAGNDSVGLWKRFSHSFSKTTCAELADKLARCPLTAFGTTLACSAYHAPGTVILGDAAHAVTPNLGQGCNVAVRSSAQPMPDASHAMHRTTHTEVAQTS